MNEHQHRVADLPHGFDGRGPSRLARESAWLVGMFVVYNLGRILAAQHTTRAFDNAGQVWNLERALGLPDEQVIQHAALSMSSSVVELANVYYATVHFPLTIAVLLFLYLRRPLAYLWTRRTLVGVTAAALVGHLVYPLAPPRMLGGLGFVDTGHAFGFSVYSASTTTSVANQFAAMPSLHVAWAALVAVAMVRCTRSRWRWLWVAHPVVTFATVVVTANHYWLDGLVGLGLLAVAMRLAYRVAPRQRALASQVRPAERSVAP